MWNTPKLDRETLPTFLFVGAERAGTTWFYTKLREHPDIFLPDTKELHFFNKFNTNLEELNRFERLGLEYYTRFFRAYDGQKAIGEVCPMYLCDPYAPARIKQILPEVKIIASLRNPVDRAYSHYWMARWKGWVEVSFDEVVKEKDPRFIQRGMYHKQIARYFDLFPPGRICILIYEEVFADPASALGTLADFLDVETDFFHSLQELAQRENASSAYRSPILHNMTIGVTRFLREHLSLSIIVDAAKTIGLAKVVKQANRKEERYPPIQKQHRVELTRYYRDDIEKLEQLIDCDLNHWKCVE
jgi:hypothetical protein